MSWLTANDYFTLDLAVRDHVNDLAVDTAVTDEASEHTEPRVARRASCHLDRALISPVWRPCIPERRQAA